jgi:uncharacterized protein YbjT (DUF2867 family)
MRRAGIVSARVHESVRTGSANARGAATIADMSIQRILIIGATGLIGRPVTEQLVAAGFTVRAMVRNGPRAAALLPEQCELVQGDLHDADSIERALTGMDAVYLNLSETLTAERQAWDPDADGTMTVAQCMQNVGVKRLARISAMGVGDENSPWWAAREKLRVDNALLQGDLDVTIFRPTWFMESIALTAIGPMLLHITTPDDPLYWLAGEDYGRTVAAALRDDAAINQVYEVQGPHGVSTKHAYRQFANVLRGYFWLAPVPRALVKMAAPLSGAAAFIDALLDMTFTTVVKVPAKTTAQDLYQPGVTIEQFAEKLLQRLDWPRKKM